MKFNFPSIAHSRKYGYAFDSSAYNGHETNSSFRMYETLDDGLIQHSGDWSVTFDYLTDYLASLAAAMLTNDELTKEVSYSICYKPITDKIEFAASVVFKESDGDYSKRRYYSVREQKIKNRSAQYDTRYQELTKYQDGSRASIFALITPDYSDGLRRFQTAEAIREWADSQKRHVQVGENFPEWFGGDYHKLSRLRNALRACRYLAEALQARKDAEWSIEHYTHSVQVEAEISAQPVDEVV